MYVKIYVSINMNLNEIHTLKEYYLNRTEMKLFNLLTK